MRTAQCALVVVMFALALGACGGSSSKADSTPTPTQSAADDAKTSVCSARDDIGKQMDTLKSLTTATVTKDGVTQSLTTIKKDLQDIAGAKTSLSSELRSQVETATTAFTTSVKQIAGQFGTSVSATDSKAALITALDQLQTSYQKTLASLSCD